MELRGFSNLHFIQKVKSGEVTKTINVSRGKPGLVFKKVSDIYGFTDNVAGSPPSRLCREDGFQAQNFDSKKIKAEIPDPPLGTDFKGDESGEAPADLDDIIFGNMTLNQIRERCKGKKRKCAKPGGITRKPGDSHNEEGIDLQLEQDEYDLKEPLIRWKIKLKESLKSKKGSRKKRASPSNENAIVAVKSEQIFFDHSILPDEWEMPMPLAIEFDVPQHYRSGYETAICLASDASYLYNGPLVPRLLIAGGVEQSDECLLGNEISPLFEECRTCNEDVPTEEASDHDPTSASNIAKIPVADASLLTSFNNMNIQSEEQEEECKKNLFCQEILTDDVSSGGASDGTNCSTHTILLEQNTNSDTTAHSCSQRVELPYSNSISVFETNGTSPANDPTATSDADPRSSSAICAVSSANGLSKIEEKLSQVTACADSEKNCFQDISLSNAVGQQTAQEQVRSDSLDLQPTSRRLFSARKVISPTSQEWLRKAMRSSELSEEEYYLKCRGIYFKKQRAEKVMKTQKANQIRKRGLPSCPKVNRSNQKDDSKESPTQGAARGAQHTSAVAPVSVSSNATGSCIENEVEGSERDELPGGLNVNCSNQNDGRNGSPPQLSNAPPRLSVGCNTMRSCSENAVAFSQRQMQDIENLATKLMTELKSMKDIVEGTSHSGVSSATNWKYDLDEVKMRVENATKAEETARKWLAMMTRDCNRFCKIMKLSENDRGTSQSPATVHKGKKKISFADEAGRKLCHVKYF